MEEGGESVLLGDEVTGTEGRRGLGSQRAQSRLVVRVYPREGRARLE